MVNGNSKFVVGSGEQTTIKVETLREGHKIGKNLPPVSTKQLFLLSSVKTSGRFFQTFVAFSEKLNYKKERPKLCNINVAVIAVFINILDRNFDIISNLYKYIFMTSIYTSAIAAQRTF